MIWGVGDEPEAQTGRLFRGGIAFVALKIEKVVLSMERTISEHEKLTPRNTILAIRTRVLTFCLELLAIVPILETEVDHTKSFAC